MKRLSINFIPKKRIRRQTLANKKKLILNENAALTKTEQ